MDLIELIILLIIFLAPAIGRLFGQKPPAPPSPTEPDQDEAFPTQQIETQQIETDPISEALRQIREALAEGSTEPVRTEPEPPPPGVFEPEPPLATASSPAPKKRKEPKRKEPLRRKDLTEPIDLGKPPAVTKPAPALSAPDPAFSAKAFTHQLRDPQRAREAFILHEVFGPPRSRRR